MYNANSNEC
jgi:hypothetical protein